MIVIGNKIISEEIKDKEFVCNLAACKGACCVEGDGGAPIELDEMEDMEEIYEKVKPFLTPEGIDAIEKQGPFVLEKEDGIMKTPLVKNKACAYVNYKDGITYCGIEKAWMEKKIDFRKPVSCHLYPIRISKLNNGMEAINFEQWDICSPACENGANLKIPVYQFTKNALIRKYGEEFYNALEATVKFMEKD